MMQRIALLPDIILEHLAYDLHPQDLLQLSLTCKALHSIYLNTTVWKSKTIIDFGDLFHVYRLVTTCPQLTLDPFLKETFQQEPIDWCRYYISKNVSINNMKINERLMNDADKEYTTAYNHLQVLEQQNDISAMNEMAAKMIRILDIFPGHAGCYYILGFIMSVLNQLEEAIILLKMGQKLDNSFGPIKELTRNIQQIINENQNKMNIPPLLVNDHTLSAPLASVLLDVFAQFDQDQDGALNDRELDNFFYCTKGSHLPTPFLHHISYRFGSDSQGYLTRNGFLAFYMEQTLEDPLKTRNDVAVLGLDRHSLEPTTRL